MSLSTIILESGGVFDSAVNQDGSGNIGVNVENFPATQPVSGTVAISNVLGSLDTATGDSGVITTTLNGVTQTNLGYRYGLVTVIFSTVTGTTPGLVIQPQWSPDGGTTWYAFGPAWSSISNVATSKQAHIYAPGLTNSYPFSSSDLSQAISHSFSLPRTWRLQYQVSGTSPSFTLTGAYVNYLQ